MKIAILNDTHCGIRNSSQIFLDNAKDFYENIFFPTLKKEGIKQIIHLGDYYDNRKWINFKALNHNRKCFLEPLRDNNIKMDIIPGNHDVFYKNTNDLNSLKELLGYFISDIDIIMEPKILKYGSAKFAMLPWINSENYDKSLKFIESCNSDVLCGHLDLNGFELSRGVMNTHGMDHKLFSKFQLVLTGHFHTASTQDNILYLGSQMEFFWSDAHDDKFFYILDTETLELTKIRNHYTLFEKVVYDDSKMDYNDYDTSKFDNKFVKVVVINKSDAFMFDKFIDKIQAQQIHDLKIAENFNEFVGENVADEEISVEDTSELLNSYIEAVDTELDKTRIKKSMSKLLKEAQTTDIS